MLIFALRECKMGKVHKQHEHNPYNEREPIKLSH